MSDDAATAAAHADRLALERMVLFTDAVFAIVITLMAIEIRLPEHPPGGWTQVALIGALVSLQPKLLAYAVSYAVVALLWSGHLRRYGQLRAIDPRLLWLNLLHLFFVGLLPFCTAVLSESGTGLAVLLYAGNLVCAGLASLLAWRHASGHPALAAPTLTPALRRAETRVLVSTVLTFTLSIAVALWNPLWAMLCWMLTWPALRWARRGTR